MSDDDLRELGAPPPEPVTKVRADALKRADQAWRVRVAGGSWQEAAQLAGYSDAANCLRAVKRVFGELPEVERGELRRLWRDRLESLFRQARQDVQDRRSGAITAAVRIEQAAAQLDGLNAPSLVEVYNPNLREIDEWVATILAQIQPQLEEGDIFDGEVIDEP